MPYLVLLLATVFFFMPAQTPSVLAQSPEHLDVVHLNESSSAYDLSLKLRYLEDPEDNYLLDDVIAQWSQQASLGGQAQALNFGFTGSAYWFRVTLNNRNSPEHEWVLESLYPIIDQMEVWLVYPDGRRIYQAAGDAIRFSSRSIRHHNPNYAFHLLGGEQVDVYLRAKTSGAVQMQIRLWSEDAFSAKDHQENFILGIYNGLLLAMLAYNLLIYISIRDRSYLWYVSYILSYGLLQFSLNGLAFEYLWPESPWWNNRAIAFLIAVGMFCVLGFSRSFLQLSRNAPWLDHTFLLLMACYSVMMGLSLGIADYSQIIRAATLLATITAPAILVAGMYCWWCDFKPARYFMISWTALLLGMMCYTLKTFGLLPANFVTEYAIQIGSAVEFVLLSLALADRLRLLTLENQAMQRTQNEILEKRVLERTQALEEANFRLQQLSSKDGLTGIFNRRYLDQSMLMECKRAQREGPLSVLLIDVDHFKRFNDTHGHRIGDECLIAVALILRGCVLREADVVARYGGEEFALVLPSTNAEGACHIAEKVCAQIRETPIVLDGQAFRVTVSIGVATASEQKDCQPSLLLERADRALYVCKRNGRDHWVLDTASGTLTG